MVATPKPDKFIPPFIGTLAQAYGTTTTADQEVIGDDEKITVNQAISKVALVYERLRTIVDYSDEQLLRKNAIFRILKRLVIIERRKAGIGQRLVGELIRINYLPNNAVPERRATELDQRLMKYLLIGAAVTEYLRQGSKGMKLWQWWLHIAACELDETLFDQRKEQALTTAMVKVLQRDIELPATIDPSHQIILYHLAALRHLFRFDEPLMYSYLLKTLHPEFFAPPPDPKLISYLVGNWQKERAAMDSLLTHPLRPKLDKLARRTAVYFSILREVLHNNPTQIEEILTRPKALETAVITVCNQRYGQIRSKVVRAVIRSIIYLFITKMALALVIEIPIDYLLEAGINRLALTINILFPPFLMLMISLFIRLPKEKNTQKIVAEVKNVVYQESTAKQRYHLRYSAVRRGVGNFFFNILYLATYGITFGVVVWGLQKLHFNAASMIIFIFFLSLVSFFA
ncbi:MAG: hypothetical protein AAB817_00510, partial [Patescibacteria group bacterium]